MKNFLNQQRINNILDYFNSPAKVNIPTNENCENMNNDYDVEITDDGGIRITSNENITVISPEAIYAFEQLFFSYFQRAEELLKLLKFYPGTYHELKNYFVHKYAGKRK